MATKNDNGVFPFSGFTLVTDCRIPESFFALNEAIKGPHVCKPNDACGAWYMENRE